MGTAPVNGVTPPFTGQPVQGFSGIVRRHDGTFDVLSDNGYGAKNNSADFLLRVHRIKPDFRDGTVRVLGGVQPVRPARLVHVAADPGGPDAHRRRLRRRVDRPGGGRHLLDRR